MRLPLPPEQIKAMLVTEGFITPEQFDAYFTEAERKSQSILDVLVANKIVEKNYLNGIMAKALGVERCDFNAHPIDNDVVKLVPEPMARERQAVAFRREDDGSYDVAMTDPSDLETIELFEQRLKGKIRIFLATSDDLNRGFSVYGYAVGQDFRKLIEENVRESLANPASKNIKEVAAALPIVGIVDNILSYAMASRASDIHIEMLEKSTFISLSHRRHFISDLGAGESDPSGDRRAHQDSRGTEDRRTLCAAGRPIPLSGRQ